MISKHFYFGVLVFLASFSSIYSQKYYSFEDKVPAEWKNVTNGNLSISNQHFKEGTKSLQWSWKGGSVITVNNPDTLSENSKISGSAIWAWVYNSTPRTDSLRFDFSNSAGNVLNGFNFGLNFSGWRFLWVSFSRDLGYRYTAGNELTKMTIKAPSTGSGNLFFDMVETVPSSGISWHRSSDLQYKVGESNADWRNVAYNEAVNVNGIDLNDTVIANQIKKRLTDWFLGNENFRSRKIYMMRYDALLGRINMVKNSPNFFNQKINLIRQPDNTVLAFNKKDNTGIGLHDDMIGYKPMFNDINQAWIFELSMDVALNKAADKKQLQRCIDLLDWMYDQGYAEGSGLGTGLTQLRSSGFPFAVFLLKDYLSKDKLERYLKAVRWIAKDSFNEPGRSADEIRGAALSKLIYALSQSDPVLRVAELRSFQQYMNQSAAAIAPGYFGLIKPDYSVYHHNSPYYSEYGDDAIHQEAIIAFLLRDTKFALSANSLDNIKKAVLNICDISCNYNVPASVSGRFPANGNNVAELIPALAYLGLSTNDDDKAIANTFNRMYKPENPTMVKFLSSSSLGIQYTASLGASIALLDYSEKVKAPAQPVIMCKFLPFSGLFAANQNDWAMSVRGFSKYLLDFECIRNEGRFSRYLSYGFIQIMSESRGLTNYTQEKSLDWIHLPGSTVINLPLEKIDVRKKGNNPKERNFGDETFLGGLSLNETTGMFSVHLHDNVFNPTFRAKKSVFYFGNLVYCMGSGISNNDNSNETHTTLFQNLNTKDIKINNKPLENDLFEQKTDAVQVLKNSWGNTYIVFPGSNSFSVEKRIQTTTDYTGAPTPENSYEIAWLNHGLKPDNAKYNYAYLFNDDNKTLKGLTDKSNPLIKVFQQDEKAHIIYNSANQVWGYAFFEKATENLPASGCIKSVSKPCIVMLKVSKEGNVEMSFSDPDLNRPKCSSSTEKTAGVSSKIEIVLSANYTLQAPTGKNCTVSVKDGLTTIRATLINGATGKVILEKMN